MKTATLIALICTALDLLCLVIHWGCKLLHIRLYYLTHGIGLETVFTLFLASLFYYFLVLYKSQKS